MKLVHVDSVGKTVVCLLLLCTFFFTRADAREVKGVDIPETVTVDGTELVLNGTGIRKKLVISVYIGALYLEKKSGDAEAVIASDDTKRIVMHFLYKEVGPDKLIDAWNEGFENNAGGETVKKLKNEIDRFNSLFKEPVKKGERIVLTYRPGRGTEVSIKGNVLDTIESEEFMKALWAIWFGPKPPGKGLKDGMLGDD